MSDNTELSVKDEAQQGEIVNVVPKASAEEALSLMDTEVSKFDISNNTAEFEFWSIADSDAEGPPVFTVRPATNGSNKKFAAEVKNKLGKNAKYTNTKDGSLRDQMFVAAMRAIYPKCIVTGWRDFIVGRVEEQDDGEGGTKRVKVLTEIPYSQEVCERFLLKLPYDQFLELVTFCSGAGNFKSDDLNVDEVQGLGNS